MSKIVDRFGHFGTPRVWACTHIKKQTAILSLFGCWKLEKWTFTLTNPITCCGNGVGEGSGHSWLLACCYWWLGHAAGLTFFYSLIIDSLNEVNLTLSVTQCVTMNSRWYAGMHTGSFKDRLMQKLLVKSPI